LTKGQHLNQFARRAGVDFQGKKYQSGGANRARKIKSKWHHLFELVFEQSKLKARQSIHKALYLRFARYKE
jgi:hypothetical protein